MSSAAAMELPALLVNSTRRRACSGAHTPAASRAPAHAANEVTIRASTSWANSRTPRHCRCVNIPRKLSGGDAGGGSRSANQVVLAQVPLTRT